MALGNGLLDPTYTPTQGPLAPPAELPPPQGIVLPEMLKKPEPEVAARVIVTPDGGVKITLGGPSIRAKRENYGNFNENLAAKLPAGARATIVEEILQGIEADIRSRQSFIDNYTKGIDLLGLKIEEQTNARSQKRNVSRVRHPILLEACVKGQSAARAELLPAAGPCKVMQYGDWLPNQGDLARSFEQDMNYYLTVRAREYYPDMDRGLFELFFSGNLFKKVYTHPVRRRPVADTINVTDLIVSEDARNIETAIRVTHRSMTAPPMVRRMQQCGAWLDVPLGFAMPSLDQAQRKEREALGVGGTLSSRPEDTERCIYETCYEIDLSQWDMGEKGQPDGLAIPYVVTIDKESRSMLALRRNWQKGDTLYMRRQRYVHYCLVPGFNFLGMGYLHLLGNQTKALTAIWRILCDSGMFSCFPGGVKAKGLRMSTNEIQPGPGEWVDVDIGPFDRLQDALMPMPYKDPSAVFIQFSEIVSQDAQRLAGSIEMEVGEGRTNIPVGTMMSMIEQQTQVMAAVHKRLHTAQAQELLLLRQEFAEDPENLRWLNRGDPQHTWKLPQEFMDLNLVPASDPNIPAQTHRVMQSTALVTLAGANPDIYDRFEVHKHALRTLGIINSEPFLHQPVPMPPPPDAGGKAPDPLGPAKLQLEQQEAERKAAQETVEADRRQQEIALRAQGDAASLASRERIAQMQEDTQRLRLQTEQERTNTEQMRANIETGQRIGTAARTQNREDALAHNQMQEQQQNLGLERVRTAKDIVATGLEHQRETRLASHQASLDNRQHGLEQQRHGLDQRKHGLDRSKHGLDQAKHDLSQRQVASEINLGHREAKRDDKLARHEIAQPKPRPAAKSKPSGKKR